MWKKMAAAVLAASILTGTAWAADMVSVSARTAAQKPIVLETQGSFAIGGTAVKHDGTYSDQHFLEPQGQKAYAMTPYAVPRLSLPAIANLPLEETVSRKASFLFFIGDKSTPALSIKLLCPMVPTIIIPFLLSGIDWSSFPHTISPN